MADDAPPSFADLAPTIQQGNYSTSATGLPPAAATAAAAKMPYDQDYGITRNQDGSIYGFPGAVAVSLAGPDASAQQRQPVAAVDTDAGRIARFLQRHPEDIGNSPQRAAPAAPASPNDASPPTDVPALLSQGYSLTPGGPVVQADQAPSSAAQAQPQGALSSPQAYAQNFSDGLRDMLNSATFGGVDRLNSAIAALPKLQQGLGAFGDSFSHEMDHQRALDADHPGIAHMVNSFIGGMAPAVVMPEVPAATLMGRAAVGAGQGALLGGLDGIGNARGSLPQMLKEGIPSAAAGAILGAPLGAAFGAGTAAAKLPQIASMADHARAGVDPMLAVNGPGSVQRVAQMVKGLPFVGAPLNAAAHRTAGQIDSGVQRVARSLGESATPHEAGGALVRGANDAVGSLKARGNDLYAPVNALEADTTPVSVEGSQAAIRGILDRFPTPAVREWALKKAPQLADVNKTLSAAGGKLTFAELKAMRGDIGKMIQDKMIIGNIDQSHLKRVYGAMSDDLRAGAHQLGGPKAQKALDRADAYNAGLHKRVDDALQTVVEAHTREQAFDRVKAMAGSSARADLNHLRQITRSLPAEARGEFAAGLIQHLGRDPEGTFSAAKFSTAWSKMTPEAKRAIIGNGEQVEDLNALFRIAQQQKAADKFYNHSNSGHMTAGVLAADRIAEYVSEGHLHDLPHVLLHDAPIAALGYGAALGAAHLLASPGFARLVLRATKAQTPAAQHQVEQALVRYANDNQPIRGEVLRYQSELARRFKANAAAVAGVDAQDRMRQTADGR